MVDLMCKDLTFCHCFLLKIGKVLISKGPDTRTAKATYSKETKKLMDNMTFCITSSSDIET
jgi:hypothetical protein